MTASAPDGRGGGLAARLSSRSAFTHPASTVKKPAAAYRNLTLISLSSSFTPKGKNNRFGCHFQKSVSADQKTMSV
jgi:hypothetical protein